jgi:hypothetical protein
MITAKELLKQGRHDEIWSRYCGFFDLRLVEYMEIQQDLMLEQIQLLSQSELGRKLLGSPTPTSIDEFRKNVPLTTYEDYEPYLSDKREDVLPGKPFTWARTSGRTGGDTYKWAPYTKSMFDKWGNLVVGAMLVASCKEKGHVALEAGDVSLMTTAPPPYVSSLVSRSAKEQAPIRFVPPLEEGEKMDFQERIELGFDLAMGTGLDYFYGLASLLAKIGERFESGSGEIKITRSMLHPKVIFRLLKGFLTAKLKRRSMKPSDIWKVKGIMTGGTDTDVYKDRIEYYWGKKPLEGYGATEGFVLGLQAWNYKGLTLYPDTNFWEFIPYDQHVKTKRDPSFTPNTLLMNELTPGVYEVVFSNLHGGIFTRYRIMDLLEVISLRDDELDIDIPQFRFYSRSTDVIDLAGMVQLTEKSIWNAIQATGIHYDDWVAIKDQIDGEPAVHIYIDEGISTNRLEKEIAEAIRKELKVIDHEFADFEEMLGGERLIVTKLPIGAFDRYMEAQKQAGADIGILKPARMKPSDKALQQLIQAGG